MRGSAATALAVATNYAGLIADSGEDNSSARTTFGVYVSGGVRVEGPAAVGDGGRDSVGGNRRGNL